MAGIGIQKKGTGRAVKFGIGGTIQANVYQGKPGAYEASQYVESHFPQTGQYTEQESSTLSYKEPNKEDSEEKKLKKGGEITKGKNGAHTVIKKFGHEGAIDKHKAQITKLLKKGGKVKW